MKREYEFTVFGEYRRVPSFDEVPDAYCRLPDGTIDYWYAAKDGEGPEWMLDPFAERREIYCVLEPRVEGNVEVVRCVHDWEPWYYELPPRDHTPIGFIWPASRRGGGRPSGQEEQPGKARSS